jgi:cbb3-type cytochrome oxidase cytochrome c subunit
MNHAPLVFLGVLAAFVTSWWTLIFAPYVQIGSQQSAQTDTGTYPNRLPGTAAQGRQVYVANGCVHCHSQHVRQDGYIFDVVVTSAGTNPVKAASVLQEIAPGGNAEQMFAAASDRSPQPVLKNVSQELAFSAQKRLKAVGAAAQPVFIPLGADMARHWGARRSVGADYLYDQPVQVGNSRLGPDLSDYGNRALPRELMLAHLYDPRTTMPGSVMPAYRYLFETRAVGRQPSANALKLTGKFAPPAGQEVVPTPEAEQLVVYLQSLRLDAPLFEAPQTQIAPTTPAAGTNAPGQTNAAAGAPKNP